MEVEAVAVGEHHNMGRPPDMWHKPIIIFHVIITFQ
ncbi:hypothetical protein CSE899_12481 [Cronobacter sakazakii E899]|nr:hypothetical protein CSE899_12481 [Cronobacter sakazakii E899]